MSEGVENLFLLIKASGNNVGYDELMKEYIAGQLKYSDLKQITADSLWNIMLPLKDKKAELNADKRPLKMKSNIHRRKSERRHTRP